MPIHQREFLQYVFSYRKKLLLFIFVAARLFDFLTFLLVIITIVLSYLKVSINSCYFLQEQAIHAAKNNVVFRAIKKTVVCNCAFILILYAHMFLAHWIFEELTLLPSLKLSSLKMHRNAALNACGKKDVATWLNGGLSKLLFMASVFFVCQLISLYSKFHFLQAIICSLIQKERKLFRMCLYRVL